MTAVADLTAIVLAGGRGSRLAPWPAPKCLLPVAGVPILHRLLGHLRAQGVGREVVCVGYRAADVVAAAEGQYHSARKVYFSHAGEDASMGARLLAVHRDPYVDTNKPVLVCYGDEIADVDLGALVAQHDDKRPKGGLVTFSAYRQAIPWGVVCEGRICGDVPVTINIGFAIVEPGAWALLHAEDGLDDWINRANAATRAWSIYYHTGRRSTVNTLAELARAEEVWSASAVFCTECGALLPPTGSGGRDGDSCWPGCPPTRPKRGQSGFFEGARSSEVKV